MTKILETILCVVRPRHIFSYYIVLDLLVISIPLQGNARFDGYHNDVPMCSSTFTSFLDTFLDTLRVLWKKAAV